MKKKHHSIEQIMRVLREADGGKGVAEVCPDNGVSEQTYYRWKRKYAGMEVSDAKRYKELEEENRRLKKLLAEKELHIDVLKEVNSKKW
jgi:putative transposase